MLKKSKMKQILGALWGLSEREWRLVENKVNYFYSRKASAIRLSSEEEMDSILRDMSDVLDEEE